MKGKVLSQESRQEEIEQVLMDCGLIWERDGISGQKIQEMREELEHHLRDALRDGKPVESVVGEDPMTFAEEWGRPYKPQRSATKQALEDTSYVFVGVALAAGLRHLWQRSHVLPFDLRKMASNLARGHAVALIGTFYARHHVRRSKEPALDELSWRSFLVSTGAITLGYAALLGINLAVKGGDRSAFSEWSWRSTTVAGIVGALLSLLSNRQTAA